MGCANLQHVLRHGAVGGPFAAGHRHHAARPDQNGVLPADFFGLPWRVAAVAVVRTDQRTQSDPQAADVSAGWRDGQHFGGLTQDEIHLFVQRYGFALDVLARRIGGSEDHFAQPRHGKKHPAVRGLGHHQRGVRSQKARVHHDMNALAGCDQRG